MTQSAVQLTHLQRRQRPIAATQCFTAFCTFSKALTSIWRTRARETPNSSASSTSVICSSATQKREGHSVSQQEA